MKAAALIAGLAMSNLALAAVGARTTLTVTGEVRVSGKIERAGTKTTINGWMMITRPVWVLEPGSRVRTGDRGILVMMVGRGTPKKGSITEEVLPNSVVEIDAGGRLIVLEGKVLRKQSGRPDRNLVPVKR
jgi:hypothetical protein